MLASRRPAHPVGWLLLTPTGRLPSPRWRWWARVAAAAAVLGVLAVVTDPRPLSPQHPAVGNLLAVPAVDALFLPCLLVTLLGLVAGAWSLLGRFRRAQGTERLQLRWLALAAAVSAATLLLALATVFLSRSSTLFEVAFGVSIGVLPLAGGYAVVVLGLGQLLGRDSSLVVAAATLTVAAVFQPARRRIQQGVDRHVNRRRHDAARSIEMSMLQVSAHETVRARWAGSPRGRSAPPGRGRTPPRWLRVGAS